MENVNVNAKVSFIHDAVLEDCAVRLVDAVEVIVKIVERNERPIQLLTLSIAYSFVIVSTAYAIGTLRPWKDPR
jgi:hypothetical protein